MKSQEFSKYKLKFLDFAHQYYSIEATFKCYNIQDLVEHRHKFSLKYMYTFLLY